MKEKWEWNTSPSSRIVRPFKNGSSVTSKLVGSALTWQPLQVSVNILAEDGHSPPCSSHHHKPSRGRWFSIALSLSLELHLILTFYSGCMPFNLWTLQVSYSSHQLSFSLHELWSSHMKLVIGWTVLMVKMFLVAKWNGLIVAIKCGKLEIPHPTFYLFLFYLYHVNILPFLLSSGRRWKILDNRFCIYQICNLSKI